MGPLATARATIRVYAWRGITALRMQTIGDNQPSTLVAGYDMHLHLQPGFVRVIFVRFDSTKVSRKFALISRKPAASRLIEDNRAVLVHENFVFNM